MHNPVNQVSVHWHPSTLPLTHSAACRERGRAIGGFTLVELLVTIVVLSILLGLAVPAFRSFIQNDQQWVQTNNLIQGLNAARSDAIKSDSTVFPAIPGGPGAQICTSNDGVACTGTPWDQGWIVLGADPANPQNPPKRLLVVGPLPAGTTLTEANNNLTITFLSNGTLNTAPGALANPAVPVAFKMCDSRGAAFARYLQVTLMGRVVASPTAGQDLSSPPAPLTCP
jgi:type IV fimbrial biogenesis protein FimT